MEGVTAGVVMGAIATLSGTIITSTMNVLIAKGHYKRDVNKAFLEKKSQAYSNICQTISLARNRESENVIPDDHESARNWADNILEMINNLVTTEGMWLDKEDDLELAALQLKLAHFRYKPNDSTMINVNRGFNQLFIYFSNKNKKLHLVDSKKGSRKHSREKFVHKIKNIKWRLKNEDEL